MKMHLFVLEAIRPLIFKDKNLDYVQYISKSQYSTTQQFTYTKLPPTIPNKKSCIG